jgi:hypothetical protein
VPGDLLIFLGEHGLKLTKRLNNNLYGNGEWPKEFIEVTIILLKKKLNATKFIDHCTISLITHTARIVAMILRRRFEKKIEDVLLRDQFGFRGRNESRDASGMLRIISERTLDIEVEMGACFIDRQKAFVRANWISLMQILKETGTARRERRLISKLYMDQRVKVRLDQRRQEV